LAIYIFRLKLISYGYGFSFPRAFARSIGDFGPARFGVRGPGAGFGCSIGYLNLRSGFRDIVIRDGGLFYRFSVSWFVHTGILCSFTSFGAPEMGPQDRFSSRAFELFDHLA